jgi:anti-sigma factor RsiW
MIEPIMQDQQMGDAPPAMLEEFYWMMSLALDGLLDEADRVQFEAHQAKYPALAALWREWQQVHSHLDELPHAEPAPGFVERFEARLAQQEALQQRRVLTFSLVAAVLVAFGAIAATAGTGVYILATHGSWLGEQLHNLVYTSVAAAAWLDAVVDSLAALAGTPQAQAVGMMYVVVAIIMIFGWVQLLRRSARMSSAAALPGMR